MKKNIKKKFKIKIKRKERSFTLVELIVVSTIIVLIVFIGTVIYSQFLKKSRDAKRIKDIEAIKGALEIFRSVSDNLSYPKDLAALVPDFLKEIPKDPKTKENYDYLALPTTCTEDGSEPCADYNIWASLETPSNGLYLADQYTSAIVTPTLIAEAPTNTPIPTVTLTPVPPTNTPIPTSTNAPALTLTPTPTQVPFYKDTDGDNYGNPNEVIVASVQPPGYVLDNTDCCDSDANTKPGQTNYYTAVNACNSWDYDCDGTTTKEYTHMSKQQCGPIYHYLSGTCGGSTVWRFADCVAAPNCGTSGFWGCQPDSPCQARSGWPIQVRINKCSGDACSSASSCSACCLTTVSTVTQGCR